MVLHQSVLYTKVPAILMIFDVENHGMWIFEWDLNGFFECFDGMWMMWIFQEVFVWDLDGIHSSNPNSLKNKHCDGIWMGFSMDSDEVDLKMVLNGYLIKS